MKLTLRVWRQTERRRRRRHGPPTRSTASRPDMSFLEMLDTLNEELILRGEDPVAFDHDCREGICGACGIVINGDAHGPERTTTCQLHMRSLHGRRHHRRRAVAGRRLPGRQGPGRRPVGLRPDHPGRRLHHRPHRRRPRGPRHAGAQARRRLRLRARRVHRLRRLRGRLPQRLGDAVHLRQGQPPQRAAAGRARARRPGCWTWSAQMDEEGFGGCTLTGRVRDGLPEGHPAAVHHRHEQGVAAGHPEGREAVVPRRSQRRGRTGGAGRSVAQVRRPPGSLRTGPGLDEQHVRRRDAVGRGREWCSSPATGGAPRRGVGGSGHCPSRSAAAHPRLGTRHVHANRRGRNRDSGTARRLRP